MSPHEIQPEKSPDPSGFLGLCDVIDFDEHDVSATATTLERATALDTIRCCFHFVRDQIRHSSDYQMNPVTCRASEVLRHGTGYCYAKSHLLAALLRANGIPTGLAYQRLTIEGDSGPFCLHGLNAVYLEDWGWFRLDARGNRADIDAQFDPPTERLAFHPVHSGERDLPGIYASPLPVIVDALHQYSDWEDLFCHLPDSSDGATQDCVVT